MKKKLSLLLTAVLAASAMMTGCGGSDKANGPQTIDDIKSEETGSEESTAAGELADAQELTFVLNNEPDGIDPNVTNNSFAVPFLVNCFEGLVTCD